MIHWRNSAFRTNTSLNFLVYIFFISDILTVINIPFKEVNIFKFIPAFSAKPGLPTDFLTPGLVLSHWALVSYISSLTD